MNYIYQFTDPRYDDQPRYTGKTNNIKLRMQQHRRATDNNNQYPVYRWMRNLQSLGLVHGVIIVRELQDSEDWGYWEQYYIALIPKTLRLNLTDGGEGVTMTPEIREKIRNSNTGKIFTENHKQRIRDGNKGKVMSIGSIERTRQAHLGTHHTEETKKKMSIAHTGKIRKPFSQTHKDKLSKVLEKARSMRHFGNGTVSHEISGEIG